MESRRGGQSLTQHEPTVPVANIIARNGVAQEVTLIQLTVLVNKAMVSGDQQVIGVGRRELLDQTNQVIQGLFCGFKGLPL